MDWNVVLSYLLKGLGSALATILITYASILFAKLKSKIGEAKLNAYIDKCVKAAEQLFPNLGNKTGKEKYLEMAKDYANRAKELEPKNKYIKEQINTL